MDSSEMIKGLETSPRHFALVHALRGIAASWVVFFHASEGGHIEGLKASLPSWFVQTVFGAGHLGVAIFFAISGFVIAHSIRGETITGSYVGRFALRRSIRLDPPYWASMLLVVGLGFLSARVKGETFDFPTGDQILAHILYLQTLLGYPQINSVYWTLTYEIQFYLVLVFGTWAAQKAKAPVAVLILLPFAFTVGGWLGLSPDVAGLFTGLWQCFAVGALAYLAKSDRFATFAMFSVAAITLALDPDAFNIVSIVTALGLWLSFRSCHIETGLNWRWLQGLGTISYSLYLTHNPITGAAFFVSSKITGSEPLKLVFALSACALFAIAFWWTLERPAMALAKKIRPSAKPVSGFASAS